MRWEDGVADEASVEIEQGERFEFGANWRAFLEVVGEDRVEAAVASLADWLGSDLRGRRFLDAGSGSGLFSLAAHRLGADVVSFDFDPASVACTKEVQKRFAAPDAWPVEQGSVLDPDYLGTLGTFDIVYSWGVLHHTGAMWDALRNVESTVSDRGRLFIAIYNDQGGTSRRWAAVKRAYNKAPAPGRAVILGLCGAYFETRTMAARALRFGRGAKPSGADQRAAAMSRWHDLRDWVGGYPFEVAKPEEIFDFYRQRGYRLERLRTCGGGLGCNEYLFARSLT